MYKRLIQVPEQFVHLYNSIMIHPVNSCVFLIFAVRSPSLTSSMFSLSSTFSMVNFSFRLNFKGASLSLSMGDATNVSLNLVSTFIEDK